MTSDNPRTGAPLAEMSQRSIARMIDTLIVIFSWMVITVVIYDGSTRSSQLFTAAVCALVMLVYETAGVATTGTTIGKRVMSIMVVKNDEDVIPGWGRALRRAFLAPLTLGSQQFFILALPLLYSSAGFSKSQRGIVDRLASTRVVKSET